MKKAFSIIVMLAYAGFMSAQTTAPAQKQSTVVDHSHDGHNHDSHDGHNHGPAATTAPAAKEAAPAAAKPANPNAARIVFKEETHNFAEVPEGPQVTYEFKFNNAGKEPLILSNVRASCGCTTPSWPKEPIMPGKDGAILVTYNTQGRPGPFNKSITINSNGEPADKIIYIKGEVVKAEPEKSVPVEQPSLLSPKN
ncbi:MAG TPA: DUF1573 domain-containing protein [Chitinophagales bacterium]|nr:DUF1573 domain-containing protein [Chitinophagales bacterium]